jgi:isovaleryl-CoA dehydrogenase
VNSSSFATKPYNYNILQLDETR